MGRARETVNAPMLASSIRIYRPVERQVRRAIVSDHFARSLQSHFCAQHFQLGVSFPSVVHIHTSARFEPSNVVRNRAAPFDLNALQCHAVSIEQMRNICYAFLQHHHNLKLNHCFLPAKVARDADHVAIRTVRPRHYDQMRVKAPDRRG